MSCTKFNVTKYISQYNSLPIKWNNEHLPELLRFYDYICEQKYIPQIFLLSNNKNCSYNYFPTARKSQIDFDATWDNIINFFYNSNNVNISDKDQNLVTMNIFDNIFFIYNGGLITMYHNTGNNKTAYIGFISNIISGYKGFNELIKYRE